MAALVLLDASLFSLVVSFQAGLPGRFYSYWQRHRLFYDHDDHDGLTYETGELVAVAIRRGDVPMLRELHALSVSSAYCASMPLLQFRDAVYLATQCGSVDVLRWIHEAEDREGLKCGKHAAHASAISGHHESLQWLLIHCGDCARGLTEQSAVVAVRRGHYQVVKCLHEERPEFFTSNAALAGAVEEGRIEIVRYLHENVAVAYGGRYCKGLMDKAACAGQLEVIEYLHTECLEKCTTEAMDRAAANGHLEIVRFLHERRTEGCTVYAMDQAAAQGHLEVVRFLHENRSEGCTVYAMGGASRRGHFEVVKFLHENRSEGCSSWALAEAAEKGHLALVEFLHTNRHGVDWEDSALFRAARNGHSRSSSICAATRELETACSTRGRRPRRQESTKS